jgi:hypothetical protein
MKNKEQLIKYFSDRLNYIKKYFTITDIILDDNKLVFMLTRNFREYTDSYNMESFYKNFYSGDFNKLILDLLCSDNKSKIFLGINLLLNEK